MKCGSFQYNYYDTLMKLFVENGYEALTFTEDSRYNTQKKLFLRHDVDFFPGGILPMAKIEQINGLKSTWCFLANSPLYNLLSDEIIQITNTLVNMGHQCCMHVDASIYNCYEEMCEAIERDYCFFTAYLPLSRTVSFHRPLAQMLDNMTIPGFIGAYEKRFFSEIVYVSDSNRRVFWQEGALFEALNQGKSIQFLTHPVWWSEIEIDEMSAKDRLIKAASKTIEGNLENNCKYFKQLREKKS